MSETGLAAESRYRLSAVRPRNGIEPPRTTRRTDRFTVEQSLGLATFAS